VYQSKEAKETAYADFLNASKSCVNRLIDGFLNEDSRTIKKMITENRKLLVGLSALTGVLIETPALKKLCDLAETYRGAAKSSGAGGGDCGIVIVDQKTGILPLMSAWEKADIIPLPLHVYHYREDQA